MSTITADNAECYVYSYKDGLLAKLAHDLKFRVARFRVEVDGRGMPTEARFDARSLELVCQMHEGQERPGTFSDSDRQKIMANAFHDVLDVEHHPEVRFVFERVEPRGDGYEVHGKLTLHGQTRDLAVTSRREGGAQVAEVQLDQTQFGIKPYSAMLGALKIKPDVRIRVTLPDPAR